MTGGLYGSPTLHIYYITYYYQVTYVCLVHTVSGYPLSKNSGYIPVKHQTKALTIHIHKSDV